MADEDVLVARADPLTETDLADINRALARLDDAERLIQKAQQAGIDVEPFRKAARDNQERLLKIKQAFFPGQ